MTSKATPKLEMIAAGLGWPEGPAALPDGRLVFVESYRSQLAVVSAHGGAPRRFAYVAGAPNSCVLGAEGWVYVCQNGGTVGPWRAAEMVAPSIQRVREQGKVEDLITEVEGIRLNGPNDLVFAPDGRLLFTDPGTYNPANPDSSHIHALLPDSSAKVVIALPEPVFPNGLAVECDGSIVWGESYTGHVRRRRPDGIIEDLGRLPGKRPTPDGMKVGADGRLFVADIAAGGIRVLARDGAVELLHPSRQDAYQLLLRPRKPMGHRRRRPRREHRTLGSRPVVASSCHRRRRETLSRPY